MIRLEIEEYCQSCLDFSPDLIKPQKVRVGKDEVTLSDTVIQCEYRRRCEAIKKYLMRQMKGETE